jgi:transposase-like protein
MSGKRISKELREEAIAKVKSGRTASDVAAEYGFDRKNIYNWLSRSAEGKDKDALEISRLKRETEALKTLIGRITFEQELAKKNWIRK